MLRTQRKRKRKSNVDFASLVQEVADDFEEQHKCRISEDARKALVTPALPHKDEVDREIDNGRITVDFLKKSVRSVLRTAFSKTRTRRKTKIEKNEVIQSMSEDCPYLFWC